MNKIAFYLILLMSFTISCNSKTSNSIENAEIEKKEVSPHPKRVKQTFFTSFGDGDTLTVKSFYGGTGVEYPTYEEAVWNNGPEEMILIKNAEHGGTTAWKESFVFKNQNVKSSFSPLHKNYGSNQSLLKSIWEDILNKNYKTVVEKGISEDLIETKSLEKIGNLVDLKEKVSWKLNMKRVDEDLVQYSLFAYPPSFYGDPKYPPFIEIEASVDNSINPNKLNSFILKLKPEIDLDKFKEIGINPKYIK